MTTVVACLGLLLGLHSAAVGSLITFGTAAIYVAFLLDRARRAHRPRARHLAAGGRTCRLGRAGHGDQRRSRSSWLAFETVNIAWPRTSLAPPGAPFYQVWAAPIVLAMIAVGRAAYLALARPHLRTGDSAPA